MSKKTKKSMEIPQVLGEEFPLDLDMSCRGCGADEHTPYAEIRSETIDGQIITWKRTVCTHCGQHRTNRFGTPLAGG